MMAVRPAGDRGGGVRGNTRGGEMVLVTALGRKRRKGVSNLPSAHRRRKWRWRKFAGWGEVQEVFATRMMRNRVVFITRRGGGASARLGRAWRVAARCAPRSD